MFLAPKLPQCTICVIKRSISCTIWVIKDVMAVYNFQNEGDVTDYIDCSTLLMDKENLVVLMLTFSAGRFDQIVISKKHVFSQQVIILEM